ncbi:hypothetical protein CLV62_1542 [Dysgonomonas alginatilytica]|uniref:Uncharacterized protein n=1 Tax=Dysgonomonas alginatilytica TaxID=1605892 RepID=A0A2V3PH80_9BACT|nr:hypothetical protein [Dysgonomonas alginatilytica]PXV57152.1 hypothetical protein CLV62_1542 [Dysgonomonas alginatilytica]
MENLNFYYENLANSLKLLAIIDRDNLDRIVKEYPKFCDIPFEVCDSYLKVFSLTPSLIDNEYFDLKTIANLIRLYMLVEVLIADASLNKESEEVFFSNPKWIRISQIAKKILQQINIPLNYPEFKHL